MKIVIVLARNFVPKTDAFQYIIFTLVLEKFLQLFSSYFLLRCGLQGILVLRPDTPHFSKKGQLMCKIFNRNNQKIRRPDPIFSQHTMSNFSCA